jgi:hypothetical protein
MAARRRGTEVIRIRPGELQDPPAGINPLEPTPDRNGARFPRQTHADLVQALFLPRRVSEPPTHLALAALPAQRAPHRPLRARCWELRDNLTLYDAAYVALAEAMHAALLTGDRRLARATGPQCPIEVFRPTP